VLARNIDHCGSAAERSGRHGRGRASTSAPIAECGPGFDGTTVST